ncbi:DASH complex subunit Dam1-domain-containing protein [Schizophyllum amplum]|uniref:DASH complex subunit DAM1 n=1 Tax=Schizophyllum amplum TaxID=97359 RepID=A0A550BSH7_9AGAR|nr:DASH complex subunit Dam1-domain-containing protein [Auriculariopsis ampla]
MGPQPPRTPLRRISTNSLFRLSRAEAYPDAPEDLGFMEPAISELSDEMDTLQAHIEGLRHLSETLSTFNEAFASYLYVMEMNGLTTDWPQMPTEASFEQEHKREATRAIAAREAARAKAAAAAAAEESRRAEKSAADATLLEGQTTIGGHTSSSLTSSKPVKKKVAKPKLSAKEKKERSMEIEKVVNCLPLEFRGSDPNLRRHIDLVIEGLLDAPGRGLKITDLVKPPDLNQARVNKCLIALVNRKIVSKENSTGTVLYHWQGI